MPRASRSVCASGVLVLVLAGCSGTKFLNLSFLQSSTPEGERVVAGSVESVAQSTTGLLQSLGVDAVATPEGQAVRVACTTKGGRKFFLVFTKAPGELTERTRIHVEYEGGPDEQVRLLLNTVFNAPVK